MSELPNTTEEIIKEVREENGERWTKELEEKERLRLRDPFTDVMIDLETMGTSNTAAIMSIGAVVFDPVTEEFGGTFHAKVDLQSCMDLGLTVDASTIEWWLGQEKEAQVELLKGLPVADEVQVVSDVEEGVSEFGDALGTGELRYEKENIREALVGFGSWIEDMRAVGSLDLQRVWGNGSTFDITILENAMKPFERHYGHLLPPWNFWMHRDVRTLRDVAVAAGCEDFKDTMEFEGVRHDALADAKFQAAYVSKYWRFLCG